MCIRERCALCQLVKLGLTMAWRAATGGDVIGHVCYGCEDRVCNEIAAGRSPIRWLDTIGGCES